MNWCHTVTGERRQASVLHDALDPVNACFPAAFLRGSNSSRRKFLGRSFSLHGGAGLLRASDQWSVEYGKSAILRYRKAIVDIMRSNGCPFPTGCLLSEPTTSTGRKQLHILRETLHQFISMGTDNTEYACLKALALFRPGRFE